MKRWSKFAVSLSTLAFTFGILHSYTSGTLSPGLPIGTAVAVVGLFSLLWSESRWLPLTAFVSLGALYRVVAFVIPSTFLNFDPDAHAVRSQIVMQTGGTQHLVGAFYGSAAAFDVHGAIVALLAGLPIEDAYVFFPLAIGIVIPLIAVLTVRTLLRKIEISPHYKTIAIGCAAALGAVEASTIQYGAAPIPVTYSALFLGCAILVTISYESTQRLEFFALLVPLSLAMLMSAKVPLLLFTVILLVWIIIDQVMIARYAAPKRRLSKFPLLFSVLLLLQWMFVTEYFSFGVGVFAVLSDLVAIGDTGIPPLPAATRYNPSLLSKILGLSNILSLLVASGIAWLYFSITRSPNRNAHPILAACAVTVAFIVPDLAFGTGPGFQRVFVYAAPFICAIIPAAVVLIIDRQPTPSNQFLRRGVMTCGIIFILVLANVGSMSATPDRVGGTRYYLTQPEISGKHFSHAYISEDVYMDVYYGDEVVNFSRAARGPIYHQYTVPNPWNRPLLSHELLTRSLLAQHYQYVAHRTTVDVYRLSDGRYRLTWNPGRVLDKHYNRVYSSGAVNLYRIPR
ncbi:hypothetical protein [Haladaptatus halobius]|uniref:hypothetical protein n=1 Tax=Haladaptatus halobius TaxID=2884875 RepID=UPI001D0BDF7A|nr:hypothetical protein [Haladaptatus halobius]